MGQCQGLHVWRPGQHPRFLLEDVPVGGLFEILVHKDQCRAIPPYYVAIEPSKSTVLSIQHARLIERTLDEMITARRFTEAVAFVADLSAGPDTPLIMGGASGDSAVAASIARIFTSISNAMALGRNGLALPVPFLSQNAIASTIGTELDNLAALSKHVSSASAPGTAIDIALASAETSLQVMEAQVEQYKGEFTVQTSFLTSMEAVVTKQNATYQTAIVDMGQRDRNLQKEPR